jgi:hypothetical protein
LPYCGQHTPREDIAVNDKLAYHGGKEAALLICDPAAYAMNN